MNFEYNVKKECGKFKDNIFEDRKNKNLIKDKNEIYSDVTCVDIKGNDEGLGAKFEDLEACHLYPVAQIKQTYEPHYLKFV